MVDCLRFCLFEMYVNVVFVIRVSLTLVREQCFKRIVYFYYYYYLKALDELEPSVSLDSIWQAHRHIKENK